MNSHSIEYLAPEAIKMRDRAWRKYPAEQIKEAKRQIELGGVVEPPLIDSENRVVCGGAIVQAAKELKLAGIPVLRVSNMTPDELRLYAISAHKLADMAATMISCWPKNCANSKSCWAKTSCMSWRWPRASSHCCSDWPSQSPVRTASCSTNLMRR